VCRLLLCMLTVVTCLFAIKDILKSVEFLIKKRPFQCLVCEIMMEYKDESTGNLCIQAEVLKALQEAAEMYLVNHYKDSVDVSIIAKRVTLFPDNMRLVQRLRKSQWKLLATYVPHNPFSNVCTRACNIIWCTAATCKAQHVIYNK